MLDLIPGSWRWKLSAIGKVLFLIALAVVMFMLGREARASGTAYLVSTEHTGTLTYCIYDYYGEQFIITFAGVVICPITMEVT